MTKSSQAFVPVLTGSKAATPVIERLKKTVERHACGAMKVFYEGNLISFEVDRYERQDHGMGDDGWMDDDEIDRQYQRARLQFSGCLSAVRSVLRDLGYVFERSQSIEIDEKGYVTVQVWLVKEKEKDVGKAAPKTVRARPAKRKLKGKVSKKTAKNASKTASKTASKAPKKTKNRSNKTGKPFSAARRRG